MDNKDSMLKEVLTKTFNEVKFNQFIINLLNLDMKERISGRPIVEKSSVYENHIEYVKDIGKYTDENRKNIVASIVKLRCKPDQARTLQRNFIAKHLKDINADAAIVALYSDDSDIWRISFVKLDYTFDINGLTENITPAKRYSYLIEPKLKNHTVQEQLKKLLFNDSKKPSVEEIENVFSVEVVTDEFFKMYRDKYLDLKEFLESNSEFIEEAKRLMVEVNEFSEEFAKKLMGQVSFLYFLQKKGWLGVPIVPFYSIDRNEFELLKTKENEDVKEILDKVFSPNNSNRSLVVIDRGALNELSDIEADWLANVFKDNKKYDRRWGEGTKTFIRDLFTSYSKNKTKLNFFNTYLEPLFYEALNERRGTNEYYKRFNCKIPFLNGGLFEPIYKYEWKKINIEIPDEFFSNDNNDGLLDFFDMYNFTMNEDEPLEKEVAVDPEMLGKIFENLLDVKERKSKGAFYTPREIVHYMCQECLINYLNNETKIDTTSLELLIKYGEVIKDADLSINNKERYKMPKFIVDNLESIDKALETVSVADPSVGSGAFPLGMLNEIVKARSIITEYLIKELDNEWDIKDLKNKRSLYNLKKNAMKKSIFAVDIEPSAVDITKLRLWLSLVVDADVRTVNTLPNLDYNIMVGNSLVDEFKGIKLFDEELLKEKVNRNKKKITNQISMNIEGVSVNIGIEQEYQLLEDIQNLQSKLFDTKETSEKVKIKRDIEDKEWELIEYKLNREKGMSFKEIEEFKKQKKLNRRPYFLWKLEFSKIFKEKGGFDIVIGNPPYGASLDEEMRNILANKYKEVPDFETADYFLCKSYELLKENGINAFIIPNTILANVYAKKLRQLLIKKWNVYAIDNLSDIDVFKSATVRTCIPYLIKNKKQEDKFIKLVDSKLVENSIDRKIKIKEKSILDENIESWLNIFYQDESSMEIIEQICMGSIKLSDISEISQGLIAYDKYRGHSPETIKNRIWHSNRKIDDTYRRELQGKDVKRYKLEWNGKNWLSYGEWLAAPRKEEFFKSERILIREITNPTIMACYTKEEYYNSPSIINIINFKNVSPFYILAIINSKLISYYHNKTSPKANKGAFPKILVNDVRRLPIKVCKDKSIEEKVITLSKKIIEENNVDKLDNLILDMDKLIYKIYGIDKLKQKNIDEFFELRKLKG